MSQIFIKIVLKSLLVEKKVFFCYDDALNCILGDKYAVKPRAKKNGRVVLWRFFVE